MDLKSTYIYIYYMHKLSDHIYKSVDSNTHIHTYICGFEVHAATRWPLKAFGEPLAQGTNVAKEPGTNDVIVQNHILLCHGCVELEQGIIEGPYMHDHGSCLRMQGSYKA